MTFFERMFVATLRAIDVWFATVTGADHVDPPHQHRYDLERGSLWEDDGGNSLDGP